MPWTYESVNPNDRMGKVVSDLRTDINGLNPKQTAWMKVAVSNQHNGDARGVIFYYSDPPEKIPEPLSLPWQYQTCRGGKDYNSLYSSAEECLNRLTEKSLAVAYWAQIGFANSDDGNATLTVFYPELLG